MIPDLLLQAELRDRLAGVGEQCRAEFRIGPGLGYDLCPDMRTDPLLVRLDDRIERGRIHIPFLRENGFEGADAQLHFRELGAMLMVVVMVMIVVVRHGIP